MKILVAIDGSVYSLKALDYLAANRGMFVEGHELVMVHACPGIPGHVARRVSKDVIQGYYSEEQAKVLDPLKTQLAERNISNYTIDARHGHAAEEIIKSAHETGANLIVMGTHGHGIFGRALMGSIATKVIAESDIAVLLVK
ncbi:universal stress protein [Variovorax sp. J22R133]|uniref:universal stress protein n=1 Tax=Variovorax brevis TaxID=3053503 RepID=UPI0025781893|nr:universal stress protein [Variovorax sp. J22R133]MDM0112540.1 universal stress protein [Variovorax sp. J22R133]